MSIKILKQLIKIEREKMLLSNTFEEGIDISNKSSKIRKQLVNVSKETDKEKKRKGLKQIQDEMEIFRNDTPTIQN
jgi:hypothetical protein